MASDDTDRTDVHAAPIEAFSQAVVRYAVEDGTAVFEATNESFNSTFDTGTERPTLRKWWRENELTASESGVEALEAALEQFSAAGDSLTVAVYPRQADEDDAPAVGAVADTVRRRLLEAGVDAEVRRIEGEPGSRLVALAETGYDRIVIGGGRRSPLGKIRLGPVAEFVILNANTTVTLVR